MYCTNDPVNCIDPTGLVPLDPDATPGSGGGDPGVCKPPPDPLQCIEDCLRQKASDDIHCWGLYPVGSDDYKACRISNDKKRDLCGYKCPKFKVK